MDHAMRYTRRRHLTVLLEFLLRRQPGYVMDLSLCVLLF